MTVADVLLDLLRKQVLYLLLSCQNALLGGIGVSRLPASPIHLGDAKIGRHDGLAHKHSQLTELLELWLVDEHAR